MTSGNVRMVAAHRGKIHATADDRRALNPRTLCGRDAANMAEAAATAPTCPRCAAKHDAPAAPARRRPVAANVASDAVRVRIPARNVDGMSWHGLRVASYLRLSRDDDDSTSIESQDAVTRRTAHGHGGEISRVFTDDGLSGALPLDARPGMAALVAAIRGEEIDLAIARTGERFARDTEIMRSLANVCRVHGVMLWSSEHGALIDPETGELNQNARMTGFIGQEEREMTRKRVRQSIDEKRAQGRWSHGRAPLGYRVVQATVNGVYGKYLAEDTEYADLIRDAVKRVLDGARLQTLADEWNAAGVLSRDERQRQLYGRDPFVAVSGRRKGQRLPKVQWTATTLKSVLTSPRLLGLLLWDDTPRRLQRDEQGQRVKRKALEVYRDAAGAPVSVTVDGAGIVDELTLSRVRSELLDVRAVKTSGYETRTMLRGIAECGTCGHGLHRNAQKSGRAGGYIYRCHNAECARPASIAGPALEAHVETEFLAVWSDVTLWHDVEEGDRDGDTRALRAAERRVETLAERMANPDLHPAALDALTVNLNRAAQEADALRAQVDAPRVVSRVYDDETLGERWARGDTDVRRALLRQLGIVARVAPGGGRWVRVADRVKVAATSEFAEFVLSALPDDEQPNTPDADAAREATGVRGVNVRV